MQSVAAQIGASETEKSMYLFVDSQDLMDRLAPCAPIRGRADLTRAIIRSHRSAAAS